MEPAPVATASGPKDSNPELLTEESIKASSYYLSVWLPALLARVFFCLSILMVGSV